MPQRPIVRRFEALENRLVMAGNITATIELGNLVLRGDNLANQVTVAAGAQANSYTIIGRTDPVSGLATTINGVAQVDFQNVNGKIIAELFGGNDDFLTEGISQSFGLEIFGGEGDDKITIGRYASIQDTTPNIPTTSISGALLIDSGNGADTVLLGRIYGNGNQTINLGTGVDRVDFYINFCNDLTVNAGDNDDTLFFGYTTVAGFLSVEAGLGNDLVSYYANRTIRTANFSDLGGIDNFSLDVNVYNDDVTADTGIEADTLLFSRSIVDNQAILRTGAGIDNALIGKYYDVVNGSIVLKNAGSTMSAISLELGSENDTAEIAANVIDYLLVVMGAGSDTVTLASNLVSTRTSITGDDGIDKIRRSNNAFNNVYADHAIELFETF